MYRNVACRLTTGRSSEIFRLAAKQQVCNTPFSPCYPHFWRLGPSSVLLLILTAASSPAACLARRVRPAKGIVVVHSYIGQ